MWSSQIYCNAIFQYISVPGVRWWGVMMLRPDKGSTISTLALGECSVRQPGVWQALKTWHHFCKDVLGHLPLPLESGWQWLIMMGRGPGRLRSSKSVSHRRAGHLLELFSYFLQGQVDMESWSLEEGLFAERALVHFCTVSVPVGGNAGLAETVSTWCCDRFGKYFQTYRAGELFFRQEGSR